MRSYLPQTCLLLLGATQLPAQATVQSFGGDSFRLTLPPGYQLLRQGSPGPSMMAFGFVTNPRSDGSRGLIQVTLIDLDKAPNQSPPTLDQFADAIIGGVRQRRSNWQQSETAAELDGVHIKVIAWSGSNEPSPERQAGQPVAAMRGIMFIGIKGNVAFALHAQDVEPFAESTLAASRAALSTFTLTPHK